jgi:hypothetical protein
VIDSRAMPRTLPRLCMGHIFACCVRGCVLADSRRGSWSPSSTIRSGRPGASKRMTCRRRWNFPSR